MVRRPRAVALAAVAATALALTVGDAASAAQDTSTAASSLVLTLTPGEFGAGGGPRSATLECEPTGGTHPTSQAACDSLTRVGGNFSALPAIPGRVCSANWDPVTATARGTWKGTPVMYSEVFSNACDAWVSSDGVFRF